MEKKRQTTPNQELATHFRNDAKAKAAFNAMPPSHQAEYVSWVAEAKKPETRALRAAKALAMMKQWHADKSK